MGNEYFEKEKITATLMKETIKKDWLLLLVILCPLPIIMLAWDQFPDSIPTHFDISGNPDGYSGKAFGLFLVPVINIIMYPILLVLPKIDPRKRNYELFGDKFRIIRFLLHGFQTVVAILILAWSLGYRFDMATFIIYSVLVMFVVLGNYLGNIRSNYFIGIRTPWTLANEDVWRKTHRLTAKLWVVTSILAMIAYPFAPKNPALLITFMMIMVLVPVIYSYIVWKKMGAPENGKA
jgi:uncharacterized membrane protein